MMRIVFIIVFAVGVSLYVYFFGEGYQGEVVTGSRAREDVNSIAMGSSTALLHNATETVTTLESTMNEPVIPIVTHVRTPNQVKAVYMSSWVAGTPSVRKRILDLIDTTEINAVVIDVKDNTGVITWESRMKDMDAFLAELHEKGVYVIARIACFQDPRYVEKHKEEAVYSKSTGKIWRDRKGEPWVDTGSENMWRYIEELGKESYRRGFDEINLDYIRFPTDGKLSDMRFPISGTSSKALIVSRFYWYITDAFRREGIPVSGDVFGIITTSQADTDVLGQDFAVALETFDFVAPMVYPSHYESGTFGYAKPAEHPGEVIHYALAGAVSIADEVASSTLMSTTSVRAKIRPWYQDFDMGATYTKEMVRAQIEAGYNLDINSWMLWDPANTYTASALKSEKR